MHNLSLKFLRKRVFYAAGFLACAFTTPAFAFNSVFEDQEFSKTLPAPNESNVQAVIPQADKRTFEDLAKKSVISAQNLFQLVRDDLPKERNRQKLVLGFGPEPWRILECFQRIDFKEEKVRTASIPFSGYPALDPHSDPDVVKNPQCQAYMAFLQEKLDLLAIRTLYILDCVHNGYALHSILKVLEYFIRQYYPNAPIVLKLITINNAETVYQTMPFNECSPNFKIFDGMFVFDPDRKNALSSTSVLNACQYKIPFVGHLDDTCCKEDREVAPFGFLHACSWGNPKEAYRKPGKDYKVFMKMIEAEMKDKG